MANTIGKKWTDMAYSTTRKVLTAIAGPDKRVAKADVKAWVKSFDKNVALLPSLGKAVDLFYRFSDARDAKPGQAVTAADLWKDSALAKKSIRKYDKNNNGFGPTETRKIIQGSKAGVKAGSMHAQHIQLARELRNVAKVTSESIIR